MKNRIGFVSNSSTSSYVCQVCGDVEAGMDASLSDLEMRCCPNGHTVHDSCISDDDDIEISLEEAEKILEMEFDPADGSKEEFIEEALGEGLPASACPICTLQVVRDKDVVDYLLFKHGEKKDDIVAEIEARFSSLDDLRSYTKRVKG